MRSIDTIRKHAATFHEETGKRPTRVYLGSAYWLGLCKELKALGIDASPLLLPPDGARIDGMRITLTQGAEWHMGFSYDKMDAA